MSVVRQPLRKWLISLRCWKKPRQLMISKLLLLRRGLGEMS